MKEEFYSQVRFKGDDLVSKDIQKVEFESCIFDSCQLSNMDLSEAKFESCEFKNCDLSNTKILNTSFQDVKFQDCKMMGLLFDDCNPFLMQFQFINCTLNLSSFYALKITKTKFINCSLLEVDFTSAQLQESKFTNCELSGAVFENTNLMKADFRTSTNYLISPDHNKIKGARFSLESVTGLLQGYGIRIE